MVSPFTGKEMKAVYEKRTWSFRGEEYVYNHSAWLCEDSGELFTTDEMDDAGYVQVTNQYRLKYGIPFTDEIIAVREKYGVSAAKMSQILGIGINQWRLYEAGEVPSVSNGRMIRSIMTPSVFGGYVESAKVVLGESEYKKLVARITSLYGDCRECEISTVPVIFKSERGAKNGYAQQSLYKVKNVLLFILDKCGEVFNTKMNKILFYSDFLAYKRYGMAITGLTYRAIDYGPVPERWDLVYSYFDEIVQEPRSFGDKEGSVLVANGGFDEQVLTPAEVQILNEVCDKFSCYSSSKMTEISHNETAWRECVDGHRVIPFEYAFELKAI